MANRPTAPEPFPSFKGDDEVPYERLGTDTGPTGDGETSRRGSITSRMSARARSRTGSIVQSFIESNPPLGMWQATGEVGSKIPTLPEIRNGAFANEGWTHEGQMEHRGTNPHEIHKRRVARTSSASTRTRKSSLSVGAGAPPSIAEERHEFFPKRAPTMQQEPLYEEAAVRQARVEEIRPAQRYEIYPYPHPSIISHSS